MSLQRHRDDVVQLEIIRQSNDRAVRSPYANRLIVTRPITEVLDAGLAEMIERCEILGKTWPEPPARPRPGKSLDYVERSENRFPLIGQLVHRLLIVAVRVELPAA